MAVNNNMEGASNPLIGVALRGNKDKKRSGGVSLSLGNMVETRGGRGRGTERKQQHWDVGSRADGIPLHCCPYASEPSVREKCGRGSVSSHTASYSVSFGHR